MKEIPTTGPSDALFNAVRFVYRVHTQYYVISSETLGREAFAFSCLIAQQTYHSCGLRLAHTSTPQVVPNTFTRYEKLEITTTINNRPNSTPMDYNAGHSTLSSAHAQRQKLIIDLLFTIKP